MKSGLLQGGVDRVRKDDAVVGRRYDEGRVDPPQGGMSLSTNPIEGSKRQCRAMPTQASRSACASTGSRESVTMIGWARPQSLAQPGRGNSQ
jgi:hypothetical protein